MKGKVVGYILSQDWPPRKRMYLAYYAVHPDYQHRGIGLKLLEEVKKYAAEHGVDELRTTLNVTNEASKGLLEAAGFTVQDWRIAFLNIAPSPDIET